MNNKLKLLYFSATNATAKVVKAIGSGIDEHATEYNITLPENRIRDINFSENDIVIIGVPVYAGRVPEFLANYFTKVHGNNTYVILTVVYGNFAYEDALLELLNIFEKNGFIGIAGAAFIGEHSYTKEVATGRPDNNDLNIAYNLGIAIKEKLLNSKNPFMLHNLDIKGNYPYRKGTIYEPLMMIETDETCTNCGICSDNCPMGTINKLNNKEIDYEKCIRCCSCIKKCPVNAKAIKYEPHNEFIKIFIKKCSDKKEPEVFI